MPFHGAPQHPRPALVRAHTYAPVPHAPRARECAGTSILPRDSRVFAADTAYASVVLPCPKTLPPPPRLFPCRLVYLAEMALSQARPAGLSPLRAACMLVAVIVMLLPNHAAVAASQEDSSQEDARSGRWVRKRQGSHSSLVETALHC